MKIALVSGYFNPIHPGHIELFKRASEISDEVWVVVKNDNQSFLKKGKDSFQDENYRKEVISSIKYVGRVFISIDSDLSVNATLEKIIKEEKNHEYILAKGGDANGREALEEDFCISNNIRIIKDLGEKTYSSSNYV